MLWMTPVRPTPRTSKLRGLLDASFPAFGTLRRHDKSHPDNAMVKYSAWLGRTLLLAAVLDPSGQASPAEGAAMPNGRCKLHGGKSTGPRTPEGLERSRRANWKHGYYSREAQVERTRVRAAIRALRYLRMLGH